MSSKDNQKGGLVLDSQHILHSIKYYVIIGFGLGFLGIIIINQFAGGGGIGGELIGGIIFMIVFSYAALSGPIIAAFIASTSAVNSNGNFRTQALNSGIANGVGYIVFGFIVAVMLTIGISLLFTGGTQPIDGGGAPTTGGQVPTDSGPGTPFNLSEFVGMIVILALPNALIGSAVSVLSGRNMISQNSDTNNNTQRHKLKLSNLWKRPFIDNFRTTAIVISGIGISTFIISIPPIFDLIEFSEIETILIFGIVLFLPIVAGGVCALKKLKPLAAGISGIVPAVVVEINVVIRALIESGSGNGITGALIIGAIGFLSSILTYGLVVFIKSKIG